jgi:hypothetical protein
MPSISNGRCSFSGVVVLNPCLYSWPLDDRKYAQVSNPNLEESDMGLETPIIRTITIPLAPGTWQAFVFATIAGFETRPSWADGPFWRPILIP